MSMKILRFLAKNAVTQYGSYSKGQIIQVSDDFAIHLIQLGLAEEVMAQQPARFNKAFTPSDNPEKKAPQAGIQDPSPTGESRQSGRGITSQSLQGGRASENPTPRPFAGKK